MDTTIAYRTFPQLAPVWNKKLIEYYKSKKKEIPDLTSMKTCIIHEMVKSTYNRFRGDQIPDCYMCCKLATSSAIMEMAYPHHETSLRERIKAFYEFVPVIESHFNTHHLEVRK